MAAAAGDELAGLEDFLGRYRSAADAGARATLADGFVAWQRAHGGFPIVQADDAAVFFYAADGEQDVRLVGDFKTRAPFGTYWDDTGVPMDRARPDGAVWLKRLVLEKDARVEYQYLVAGERRLDPLNPRTAQSGIADPRRLATVSELVMPGYRVRSAATPRPEVAQGQLRTVEETWATPKVVVYLPAGYDAARTYPAVYTADGSAWRDLIGLPIILDNLVADGRIQPVLAVMIDAAEDRGAWYSFNPDYLAYLEKVVEYVDGHYATRRSAPSRVHLGTSAGGRASLFVGLERPQIFANVALLSAGLLGPPSYYEPFFSGRRRPHRGLRVWISAGSYEGPVQQDARTLEAYFKKHGVATMAVYTHEAHTFAAWRNLVQPMLEYFFPARRAAGGRRRG